MKHKQIVKRKKKCDHSTKVAGKVCEGCGKKFPSIKGESPDSKTTIEMQKAPVKTYI